MMKAFVLVLVAVVVTAEPPAPTYLVRFPARQEAAPYPVAGLRPAGQLRLPARQQNPPTLYGPPTESSTEFSTDAPTTDQEVQHLRQGDVEGKEKTNKSEKGKDKEKLTDVEEIEVNKQQQPAQERGVYYIVLPSGLLQKVEYATAQDVQNMAYTAQLQYRVVEPIRGPIYAYNPNAPLLQIVQ